MPYVLLVLVLLVRAAHADVGVVVTGDPAMQTPMMNHVQRWLQDKKHPLVAAPLGDATTTFVDCFVVEDMTCAKKVFEDKAKATAVVFVRIEMQSGRDYALTAYWFTKGAEPIPTKRACAQCDDSAMWAAVDATMTELVKQSAGGKGRLRISASAPGMMIKIDGNELGEAPLDHELTAGQHELVFLHDGEPVDVRRIDIEAGGIAELDAPKLAAQATPADGPRSKTLPRILLASGIAAAIAGGVFLYYGSLRGPDEPYVYTNATEIGLPLALAGAFAVGFGFSGSF